MYVCMYVCPSRLGMPILVHCARALVFPACCKGLAQRLWPHYYRERRVEHKEVLNRKKTMHADAMDGSISTKDEDSASP